MNFIKILLNFVLVFLLYCPLQAQEQNVPERTAEQEAARQTERLHQEVNLTPEQEKKVYDINLKYARERFANNSRRESLERSKAKEQELMQVLSPEQNNRLQEKRVERSVYQTVLGTRAASPSNTDNAPSNPVRTDRQYQSPGTVRSDFRQNEAAGNRPTSTNDDSDRSTRYSAPSTNRTSSSPTRTAVPSTERSSSYTRQTENNTSRSAAPATRPTTPQYENRTTVPATRQQPTTSSSRSSSTAPSNSNSSRSSSASENRNSNETRSSSTQRSSSTSR